MADQILRIKDTLNNIHDVAINIPPLSRYGLLVYSYSPDIGLTTDAEASSGNGSLIALIKNLRTRIAALEAKLDTVISNQNIATTLTARMKAFQPFDSTYRIWVDTSRTDFIYIAENVASAGPTATDFRGIRIPLVDGNPKGETEVNTAFRWSDFSGGTWT